MTAAFLLTAVSAVGVAIYAIDRITDAVIFFKPGSPGYYIVLQQSEDMAKAVSKGTVKGAKEELVPRWSDWFGKRTPRGDYDCLL